MGREVSYDPTTIGVHSSSSSSLSSIALLQERFRQLQRVKEIREEKELIMKMLFVADHHHHHHQINIINKQYFNVKPTMNYYDSASRLFYSPPQPQVSLTLWPTSKTSFEEDYKSFDEPQLTLNSKVKEYSVSDIDTSLHL